MEHKVLAHPGLSPPPTSCPNIPSSSSTPRLLFSPSRSLQCLSPHEYFNSYSSCSPNIISLNNTPHQDWAGDPPPCAQSSWCSLWHNFCLCLAAVYLPVSVPRCELDKGEGLALLCRAMVLAPSTPLTDQYLLSEVSVQSARLQEEISLINSMEETSNSWHLDRFTYTNPNISLPCERGTSL